MQKNKYRICIWMNTPSHYQSAFFNALAERAEIDLKVCYFRSVSTERIAEGWADDYRLNSYETSCESDSTPMDMVAHVSDWKERIHIVSMNFSSSLINYLCKERVPWCHWSEMPGIRLAGVVGYRMSLFRLLNPLMLTMKSQEGSRIRRYACGAFAQGRLAQRAFKIMGVPSRMIEHLYYSPAALAPTVECNEIKQFSRGRNVFLYVGALCKRKGIDILLKAFSSLKTKEWCLVLCGFDREDGKYIEQARKLGVADRTLFLGAWPSSRIAEVYSAADVFILPSRFDGWGAVINEGASMGLPVIGTDLCGASWHLIHPGLNGFRVRGGSVASLSSAMKAYVNNPELVKLHGHASSSIFSADFSPMANAERLIRAIEKWDVHED